MTASISAQTIDALHAIAKAYEKAGHDITAALREAGRTEECRIGGCVAAERPGADSAGRGTSGGLGERLRATTDGIERANRELARFGLRPATEGRCLTCPGGHGRHKVGGKYPELPHEVVVETKPEANESEEGA